MHGAHETGLGRSAWLRGDCRARQFPCRRQLAEPVAAGADAPPAEARGDARRAADRPRQPPAAPELGRAGLLLQGEAAARRAGRGRARHPRAGRSGVGRGDDRGGADRDLLFPAAGDRGLQHAVSADPDPDFGPIGQRRARGGAARPGRVRDQSVGRAGAGHRLRAVAARAVPVRLPARSCRWRASNRSAGRTSRPTDSSRSAGSAATG